MSCCDTISEEYNSLRCEYVELMNKELDLQIEVERLREQLKEANDVIQYALEMSSDDDSTRVFEDYLEVIE
jgi:regulator of replication initiation timing